MTSPVGQQIRAYRRKRGMSQAALAARVGRSESWLSQVERGVRGVDRLSVLNDLADVLGIDPVHLGGPEWSPARAEPGQRDELDRVRRAFATYDALLQLPPLRTPSPAPAAVGS